MKLRHRICFNLLKEQFQVATLLALLSFQWLLEASPCQDHKGNTCRVYAGCHLLAGPLDHRIWLINRCLSPLYASLNHHEIAIGWRSWPRQGSYFETVSRVALRDPTGKGQRVGLTRSNGSCNSLIPLKGHE